MTLRGVFFDAGETLVHPHPSFTELLLALLRTEGHDVEQADVRVNAAIVARHFQRAADEGITRVDWDLNLAETPLPEQLAAYKSLAGRLW